MRIRDGGQTGHGYGLDDRGVELLKLCQIVITLPLKFSL